MKRRQITRRTILLILLVIFPLSLNYYSPALPIMGLYEDVPVAGFSVVFWTAWFVAAFVFGRASCGYFCPLGALQELWDWASSRPLFRIKNLSVVKYIIFVLWIGSIAAAMASRGFYQRFDPIYMTENYVSLDSWEKSIIYSFMLGLVILLAATMGKRAFCHYLCWWAPLNSISTRLKSAGGWPSLRLTSIKEKCAHCLKCEKACPMSLPVNAMIASGNTVKSECILCGSCVDTCPNGAINYTWK